MAEQRRSARRAVLFAGILLYAVLLTASWLYQYVLTPPGTTPAEAAGEPHVVVDALDADGQPIPGRDVRIFYNSWPPDEIAPERLPVVLIHGSPGDGTNFIRMAPPLAMDGRRVIAPDLPGYGKSDSGPDLSFANHARYVSQMLDALDYERVHVVGWSSGGAVAQWLAHQQPQRVASLTLLAAIGAQETEGSGSYFFEHLKYGVGLVTIGGVPELVPHFGLLGTLGDRTGWLWSFWDSDQRRLSAIMPTIETPTLILHGRNDRLVADWAAQRHHDILPASKLTMLDASHFLPFFQLEECVPRMLIVFNRHDHPGVPPFIGFEDLAPVPERDGFDALVHLIGVGLWELPWWAALVLLTLLVRWRPVLGMVLVMLFVAMMRVDFGVGFVAMMGGRVWWLLRAAGELDRPQSPLRWTRAVLFVPVAFVVGAVGGGWTLDLSASFDWFGLPFGIVLTYAALNLARLLPTWEGRQRIKAWLRRRTNHEYWSIFTIYLPVLCWGMTRVMNGKGLRSLTAVNPGYAPNAGARNESKHAIVSKLGDEPPVLHCVLIEAGADQAARIERARSSIGEDERLGGYPVICKPDRGERGRGVRLARTEQDIAAYCRDHREDFVIQKYHPGPAEIGVVWVRSVTSITDPRHNGPPGFIYAINIKHFPQVVGDGTRTLRRLILAHPRHRVQARVLLNQLASVQHQVPREGERVALGVAGNHSQGAKFTDGADLNTEELTRAINAIAARLDPHGGFDIGRFDLRCESLEQLARGEGFGIVELNGLTSEPTNLYDPSRKITWAWAQLRGYWKHAAELATARIETGTGEPVDRAEFRALRREMVRVMVRG